MASTVSTVIHKQPLSSWYREETLNLPRDAEILCVQTQDNIPTIWYQFSAVHIDEYVPRRFKLVPTGETFELDVNSVYIGTVQIDSSFLLVYHLYEVMS